MPQMLLVDSASQRLERRLNLQRAEVCLASSSSSNNNNKPRNNLKLPDSVLLVSSSLNSPQVGVCSAEELSGLKLSNPNLSDSVRDNTLSSASYLPLYYRHYEYYERLR